MFSYKHNSSSSLYHGNDIIHEAYCKKGLYQKSSRSAIYTYVSTGTCTCMYTVKILIVAQQLYFLYLQNI